MRRFLKRIVPGGILEEYRRRRALRRFLRSLSYEIYDRQRTFRVEEIEGSVLARRPDITERLMKDLLDRMDLLLQELHRQIEGLRARHGTQLHELQDEVERLRTTVADLQSRLEVRAPAAD
jgi:hypothetical protein